MATTRKNSKFARTAYCALALTFFAGPLKAEPAFKINGKPFSVEDLAKENQGRFYDIEQKRYELISNLAREKFLDDFWQSLAVKEKTSVEKARDNYLNSRTKVSDAEIKEAIEQFKDYPQLKDKPDAEKKTMITDYLKSRKSQEVFAGILQEASSKKQLDILYPEPKEPIFKLALNDTDPVKYGPNPADTKPLGCSGNSCQITIVEYSEFQCPFCERVQPAVKKIMKDYQGKIRWAVRDFPLGFHNRAKPAAIAARCAKEQGKFWEMYEELFKNQKNLSDADFKRYASAIKLDVKKFENCVNNPGKVAEVIEANLRSGEKVGVTGTPAYFVNGRRLSGALPYEEFKRVIDSELAKK